MKIQVTEAHIQKAIRLRGEIRGTRALCEYCPIAQAIQEATGDPNWESLCGSIVNGKLHKRFPHAEETKKFIESFDCWKYNECIPFEFDLPIEETK